jgi:glycosyltransferase involved in cell wall biosynthesis
MFQVSRAAAMVTRRQRQASGEDVRSQAREKLFAPERCAMSRRRLLLVAVHYPPIQDSSGVHRSLAFSKYLPEFGWDVTVLTVHSRAHEKVLSTNLRYIPQGVEVLRAPAWDAARHFAIAGRYPSMLAIPDRWSSWIPFAIIVGTRALRGKKFDAIFSTFPIASAHVIACKLHRRARLPWIADFRDPMVTTTYPAAPSMRARWSRIESKVMHEASRVTVTTPGAANYYRRTYGDLPNTRVVVIENGFDEEMFPGAAPTRPQHDDATGPAVLLHSGVLYIGDRNPLAFFRALRRLVDARVVDSKSVQVRLRASGFEDHYRAVLQELELPDIVRLLPPVPYAEALQEMREASALLLFQGTASAAQIPAKAYEYLYAGRPILGLSDPRGDTGQLLRRFGIPGISALEDEDGIFEMLKASLPRILDHSYPVPPRETVSALSRRAGAAALAELLDQTLAERSANLGGS